MKLTYYLLLIATLLLTACNNDEDEEKEFIMTTPPIGETFEGSQTSITFESEDSVSIRILYPEDLLVAMMCLHELHWENTDIKSA